MLKTKQTQNLIPNFSHKSVKNNSFLKNQNHNTLEDTDAKRNPNVPLCYPHLQYAHLQNHYNVQTLKNSIQIRIEANQVTEQLCRELELLLLDCIDVHRIRVLVRQIHVENQIWSRVVVVSLQVIDLQSGFDWNGQDVIRHFKRLIVLLDLNKALDEEVRGLGKTNQRLAVREIVIQSHTDDVVNVSWKESGGSMNMIERDQIV